MSLWNLKGTYISLWISWRHLSLALAAAFSTLVSIQNVFHYNEERAVHWFQLYIRSLNWWTWLFQILPHTFFTLSFYHPCPNYFTNPLPLLLISCYLRVTPPPSIFFGSTISYMRCNITRCISSVDLSSIKKRGHF